MLRSERHEKLKTIGKALLVSKGFSTKQIYMEYNARFGRKRYLVDVVGKDEKRFVAIECGAVRPLKLVALKHIFTEVIHLPFSVLILGDQSLFNSLSILFNASENQRLIKEGLYSEMTVHKLFHEELPNIVTSFFDLQRLGCIDKQLKELNEADLASIIRYMFDCGIIYSKQHPEFFPNSLLLTKKQRERREKYW